MQNIFEHIEKREKLNKNFILLDEFNGFKPAKDTIIKISRELKDKDGNFKQQFQTTGFESRLWELYLYMLFKESHFEILYDCNRPDFHLKKNNVDFFVEASISTEKSDDIYTEEFIKNAIEQKNLQIQNELTDYYIIRMGSVLYSKLNKNKTKYWELDWVKGKPLVIAITPFHNYLAKFLPDSKIIEYLYGISYITEINEKGLELKEIKKTKSHRHKTKANEIPSYFFNQENVENISAVIFTNNCDLHKFNRMGFQSSNEYENINIVRSGVAYDSNPKSSCKEFDHILKAGKVTEEWKESVSIFHNPNAIHKIDKDLFSGYRQLWQNEKGDGFIEYIPDFFVYNSLTIAAI